jgi:hypothetical protein
MYLIYTTLIDPERGMGGSDQRLFNTNWKEGLKRLAGASRGHIIFKNDSERRRRSNSPFFHTDDEFLIQRNFTGLRLVPTIKQVDNIIKFYYRAVISCFLFPFSPPRRHSHSLQCVKNILPFLAISFSPYYSI